MSRPWFDKETGLLCLDEYVAEMESFQKVMEDGIVTDEEIVEHSELLTKALKKLESLLDDDQKEAATDVLCELSVLHAIAQVHRNQQQ